MKKPLSLLNPLRWIDTTNINSGFDGDFYFKQLHYDQQGRAYAQPFNNSDRLVLQVISDEVPNPVLMLGCGTNQIVKTIDWVPSTFTLLGLPDFTIYEISEPFTGVGMGYYYFSFDEYTSEAIHVDEKHPDTVLIKYKHSDNDYDVVFETGIEFQYRIDGRIQKYTPLNDRDAYFDQTKNATQLSSVAYRKFTLYIGKGFGVPDWAFDKIGLASQCDQFNVNCRNYQILPDAEFEVENNESNNYIGGSIEVQPVENNFTKYVSGNNPNEQTFQPMRNSYPYPGVGTDFQINGIFKFNSILDMISIKDNDSPSTPFTINIGTTNGGSEIGSFLIEEAEQVYTVRHQFSSATPVFITGANGKDLDIYLVRDQIDEPYIPVGSGGGLTGSSKLFAGTKFLWEETQAGDFARLWDESTGLGRANTPAFGWTIAGYNGTESMDNSFPIGVDRTGSNWPTTLGNEVGANLKSIPRSALPAEGLGMFTGVVGNDSADVIRKPIARAKSAGGQLAYEVANGGNNPIVVGATENLGEGTASFEVTPKSKISMWVIKLEDDV